MISSYFIYLNYLVSIHFEAIVASHAIFAYFNHSASISPPQRRYIQATISACVHIAVLHHHAMSLGHHFLEKVPAH